MLPVVYYYNSSPEITYLLIHQHKTKNFIFYFVLRAFLLSQEHVVLLVRNTNQGGGRKEDKRLSP
ncbi:MAG TPA: hypothetical protein VFW11_20655 [Cyclobacteriaceae bacterium]|nr:hypothetical protein [Cyclobacteriaceae bacterium]